MMREGALARALLARRGGLRATCRGREPLPGSAGPAVCALSRVSSHPDMRCRSHLLSLYVAFPFCPRA